MKHIKLIKQFELETGHGQDGDKSVSLLFDGTFRKLVEVRLQNSAILSRHHADVPITVYCVSGNGVFSAGEDLEDTQVLKAGTLITLETGVEHEVLAEPDLHILVTKFLAN